MRQRTPPLPKIFIEKKQIFGAEYASPGLRGSEGWGSEGCGGSRAAEASGSEGQPWEGMGGKTKPASQLNRLGGIQPARGLRMVGGSLARDAPGPSGCFLGCEC